MSSAKSSPLRVKITVGDRELIGRPNLALYFKLIPLISSRPGSQRTDVRQARDMIRHLAAGGAGDRRAAHYWANRLYVSLVIL